MSMFDGLKKVLAKIESEEEAGVKLVLGIATHIEAAGSEPSKLNDLIRELREQSSALVYSVLVGDDPSAVERQPTVPASKPAPSPQSVKQPPPKT